MGAGTAGNPTKWLITDPGWDEDFEFNRPQRQINMKENKWVFGKILALKYWLSGLTPDPHETNEEISKAVVSGEENLQLASVPRGMSSEKHFFFLFNNLISQALEAQPVKDW